MYYTEKLKYIRCTTNQPVWRVMEEQEMPGSGDVSSPGLRPGYGKPRSIRLPTEVDEWVERYMKETHLAFTAVVKQALYELRKREGRN